MSKMPFILLLAFATFACSTSRKSKPDVITVTVIDQNGGTPVDSARVILTSVVDARDVFECVQFTDKQGYCRFSRDYNPLAQYQVRTIKKGLVGYFDSSYPELDRSFSFLNEKTGNNITLYLTSDSLNHEHFRASHTRRFEADSLVSLLKSNTYPLRSEFPLLLWDDIPALLAYGNSRIEINKYPISVLSSSYTKKCYLGIICLWFIESDRIALQKKLSGPAGKFPSLTPQLQYKAEVSSVANSSEIMEFGWQAYTKWWNTVKGMGEEQGCKINPLEGTNLEWR